MRMNPVSIFPSSLRFWLFLLQSEVRVGPIVAHGRIPGAAGERIENPDLIRHRRSGQGDVPLS
jgi:hypothetical protein